MHERPQHLWIVFDAMNDDDDFRACLALFEAHGGTDADYLRVHFRRYVDTYRRVIAGRTWQGARMLDIGAHWLHQSLMYARAGLQVIAVDLPAMLDAHEVRTLAGACGIELLPNADLEHADALRTLPDDSVDIVLFTEIIEHLAFNPRAMWREIQRVLKPGGRVVVTTPNHYALRSVMRRQWRAWRGLGGGVLVAEILDEPTRAHHWKEYSRRELVEYFRRLSPDFHCAASAYTVHAHPAAFDTWPKRCAGWIERAIPFLRPGLYLEIELAGKPQA